MNPQELTTAYVQRLVHLLVLLSLGDVYTALVASDMLLYLLELSRQSQFYDLATVMAEVQQSLVARGKRLEWTRLQKLIHQLVELKRDEASHGNALSISPEEQVARYLVFILSLPHQPLQPLRPTSYQPSHSIRPALLYAESLSRRGLRIHKTRSVILGQPSLAPYILRSRLPQRPVSTFGYPGSSYDQYDSAGSMEDEYGSNDPDYTPMGPEDVKTLQHTLLGHDTRLIYFNNEEALAAFRKKFTVGNLRMLALIVEAAVLYKLLVVNCTVNRGQMDSPIKTAFLSASEDYLNKYLTFIDELFATGNAILGPPTTVIGVYGPVMSQIYALRLLHGLVGLLDVNGYTFLSRVDELSKFGDRRIKGLCLDLFHSIVTPYYDVLDHWILDGNLTDDLQEFFITIDDDATDFNDIVHYNAKMIPAFIPASVGAKIYQIGKMLVFLKKCKQLQWLAEYRQNYDYIINQQGSGLKDMDINEISEIVLRQYSDLLHGLTLLLEGSENEMFAHITNFKRFYLTQASDFIDAMIVLGPNMVDDLGRITTNQLAKALLELIRILGVKNSRYQNRLEAYISEDTPQGLGLNVFSIDYRIDDLCINFLFQSQMPRYRLMCTFLLRVRVAGFALGQHFVQANGSAYREIASVKNLAMARWLPKSARVVGCIRLIMVQFIDWLIYYLLFDLIEPAFKQMAGKFFKSKVNTAQPDLDQLNPNFLALVGITSLQLARPDHASHNMNELTIDEIIASHQDYLDQLLSNKLLLDSDLGPVSAVTYSQQIEEVLAIIEHFIRVLEVYFGSLLSYTGMVNRIDPDDADAQMEGDIALVEQDLKESYRRIQILGEQYRQQQFQLQTDMDHDPSLNEYAMESRKKGG